MNNIIVSIDGHCNIPKEICEIYDIKSIPFEVFLDGQVYLDDSIKIKMEDIYEKWKKNNIFPKTSAISPGKYMEFFKSITDKGYKIIHINLASGGSACFNNCKFAIEQLNLSDKVFQFDSQNISFGLLILAIHTVELVKQNHAISTILIKLAEIRNSIRSSYLLDNLHFLQSGGRLKKTEILPNDFKLEINVKSNKIEVGRKFQGPMNDIIVKMIKEKLENDVFNKKTVFIDISLLDKKNIIKIKEILQKFDFQKIYIEEAKCSCAGHWGANAFGIYYEGMEYYE